MEEAINDACGAEADMKKAEQEAANAKAKGDEAEYEYQNSVVRKNLFGPVKSALMWS
jgi:hypothetical protein